MTESSSKAARDLMISVRVTEQEMNRIDEQRGRLNRSEYLRDRSLHPRHASEPSIAAIGKLYQSSGRLIASARGIDELIVTIREIVGDMSDATDSPVRSDLPALTKGLSQLGDRACALRELGRGLQSDTRDVARDHMARVFERRPPITVKKRGSNQ